MLPPCTYGYPNSDVDLDSILLNVLKIQTRQGAMTEAVALYDYQTNKNGRLALKKDDRITNITKVSFTIRNYYIYLLGLLTAHVTIVMQYMCSL